MSVTARRLVLSAFAALIYLPVPILAAKPGLAPGLAARAAGLPLSVLAGLVLTVALVALAWLYAREAADRPAGEGDR